MAKRSAKPMRYFGATEEIESDYRITVYGPSTSRVPVRCGHCREYLTVRGRSDKRCTECKHDQED